ncbi:MAG: WbqC family protein [Akkermansiaceae bacterium]|jgi:hypothetical protein
MQIAIMQPYFLPYIGYFQLINAVDIFVLYDNIEFTKKGWINRNRYLMNGEAKYFTIPLKKDSDFLDINQRVLSDTWPKEKGKILNKISEAYRNAPFHTSAMHLVKEIFDFESVNLFDFNLNAIRKICALLDVSTPIVISSALETNRDFKKEKRVLDICQTLNASSYINPIGGVDLYDKFEFKANGIKLSFLKTADFKYNQGTENFTSHLSILDILMHNDLGKIKCQLKEFDLI